MSWEQLTADALANRRIRARESFHIVVGAQCDQESWKNLQRDLLRIINQPHV